MCACLQVLPRDQWMTFRTGIVYTYEHAKLSVPFEIRCESKPITEGARFALLKRACSLTFQLNNSGEVALSLCRGQYVLLLSHWLFALHSKSSKLLLQSAGVWNHVRNVRTIIVSVKFCPYIKDHDVHGIAWVCTWMTGRHCDRMLRVPTRSWLFEPQASAAHPGSCALPIWHSCLVDLHSRMKLIVSSSFWHVPIPTSE